MIRNWVIYVFNFFIRKESAASASGQQVYALQSRSGTRFCKFVDVNGVPATPELVNQAMPILKNCIQQLPKGLSTVTISISTPEATKTPPQQQQQQVKQQVTVPTSSQTILNKETTIKTTSTTAENVVNKTSAVAMNKVVAIASNKPPVLPVQHSSVVTAANPLGTVFQWVFFSKVPLKSF